MPLQYFNVLDEQQRWSELRVYEGSKPLQCNTHTMSYLYLRGEFIKMGDIMGLDQIVHDSDEQIQSP